MFVMAGLGMTRVGMLMMGVSYVSHDVRERLLDFAAKEAI